MEAKLHQKLKIIMIWGRYLMCFVIWLGWLERVKEMKESLAFLKTSNNKFNQSVSKSFLMTMFHMLVLKRSICSEFKIWAILIRQIWLSKDWVIFCIIHQPRFWVLELSKISLIWTLRQKTSLKLPKSKFSSWLTKLQSEDLVTFQRNSSSKWGFSLFHQFKLIP